jgi:two-component system sensor histidine kinase KdpD
MANRKDDSLDNRPSPEELLERVTRAERKAGRGKLKLFIGFAAGVGKTFQMLSEANRRKLHEPNLDVVVGYVETHGRKGTAAQIGELEVIPRRKMEYRGSEFEEMDIDAVIARHPDWAVVDELAHTNIPGSRHEKRFEDVLELLENGISVLSTMNVQHLESLNDVVQQITGVKVRETVPDWVLGEADEIVTIDITPGALINRLHRGDVYPTDKVPSALRNFFTEGNLSALREIALREVASSVDRSVQNYRVENNVSDVWHTNEKIMVCISAERPSDNLLRRGWRIANRLHAEIVAVYVSVKRPTIEQSKILDANYQTATRLNIKIDELQGTDVAKALAEYATKNRVTELVLGHALRERTLNPFQGSIVTRLVSLIPNIDVLVMADKQQ